MLKNPLKFTLTLLFIVLMTAYITKSIVCPENNQSARLEFDLPYQIKDEPKQPSSTSYVHIRIEGVGFPYSLKNLTELNDCVPSGYLWSSAEFQDNGSKYLIICLRPQSSNVAAGNVLLYKHFKESDEFAFTGAVSTIEMDEIRVVIPGNSTAELHHNRSKTGQFRRVEILGM